MTKNNLDSPQTLSKEFCRLKLRIKHRFCTILRNTKSNQKLWERQEIQSLMIAKEACKQTQAMPLIKSQAQYLLISTRLRCFQQRRLIRPLSSSLIMLRELTLHRAVRCIT